MLVFSPNLFTLCFKSVQRLIKLYNQKQNGKGVIKISGFSSDIADTAEPEHERGKSADTLLRSRLGEYVQ